MDVTAVLLTSLTLAGVSGAAVAPASPVITASTPTSVSALASAATQSSAGPAREVSTIQLPSHGAPAIEAAGSTHAAGAVQAGAVQAGTSVRAAAADPSRVPTTLTARLAPTRGNGATFEGSTARSVEASLLPRLGGRALLDQLSLLPSDALERFVAEYPQAIDRVLSDPPSADAVADWWSLLGSESRLSLRTTAPELVGNLDGIVPAVRDAANRSFLRRSIDSARADLADLGRGERADAEQRLVMLEEIQESLVTTSGQPPRTLLSVDTAWPGRAAVVVGDLATADYVSYMVPGMFFTVTGQIVDWTIISQDLYDEQAQWVDRLGRTDPALAGDSIAVVSWIGYQTPGITDVVSLDLAEDGAKYISNAVEGVHETRTDTAPHVTLVTHSYGSTATLMALESGGLAVDSLVIIGSPGGSAQSVNDLGMPSDEVFVGEAAWDPVVDTAFFGNDPGSPEFGASSMSVEGGVDPVDGTTLAAASGHLGYFDAGTEAMRNMALVGLDRGDLVTDDAELPPERQLADG